MITTVTFTGRNIVFSYDFLHVKDHPIIGVSLMEGVFFAFREFRRYINLPIWDFNVLVSKRP